MSDFICSPTLHVGCFPFNVDYATSALIDVDPPQFAQLFKAQYQAWCDKRRRARIRATAASNGRWKPDAPSMKEHMDDLESYAHSINCKPGISIWDHLKVSAWMRKAKQRKLHASKAANARWEKWRACRKHEEHAPVVLGRTNSIDLAKSSGSFTSQERNAKTASTVLHALKRLVGRLDGSEHHRSGSGGSERPENAGNGHLGEMSDSRREAFKGEISTIWAQVNGGMALHWMDNDERALNQFLQGHPEMNQELLHQLMLNWSKSAPRFLGQRPSKWLCDLLEWGRGPLDEFRNPPGKSAAEKELEERRRKFSVGKNPWKWPD